MKLYNDDETKFVEFRTERQLRGSCMMINNGIGWNTMCEIFNVIPQHVLQPLIKFYRTGTSDTYQIFEFLTYEEYWNFEIYFIEANQAHYEAAYLDYYR